MNRFVVAIVFGFCGLGAQSLHADLIVSNLSGPLGGDFAIWNGGLLANPFTAGNRDFMLESGVVSMYHVGNDTSSLFVGIYADNSGRPGVELARFEVDYDDIPFSQPDFVDLTMSTPFLLEAGTSYLMVFGSLEPAFTVVFGTATSELSETGPGTIGTVAYRRSDGGWDSYPDLALHMELHGQVTPEPSSSVFLVACLLFLLRSTQRQPSRRLILIERSDCH